jgi:hypothetical protein
MASSLYRLLTMHRDRRKPIQGILQRRADKIASAHLPRSARVAHGLENGAKRVFGTVSPC